MGYTTDWTAIKNFIEGCYEAGEELVIIIQSETMGEELCVTAPYRNVDAVLKAIPLYDAVVTNLDD